MFFLFLEIWNNEDKPLQITKEHFNSVFNNEPSNYFVYDSSKLDQVRSFENRYI